MQIKSAPSVQQLTVLAVAGAALAVSVALGSQLTSVPLLVGPALDRPNEQSLPATPAAPEASASPQGRSLAGDGQPNGVAPRTPADGAPPVPADQPAQGPSTGGQGGGQGGGQVERPGKMFDDMPIDPPAHEPGTGTPRWAGD